MSGQRARIGWASSGGSVDDVLAVVEHEEQPPVRGGRTALRRATPPWASSPRGRQPRAVTTSAVTSSGSRRDPAQPTRRRPGTARGPAAAACRPAGSSRRRPSRPGSAAGRSEAAGATSASSCSRPTKEVSATGRLWRLASSDCSGGNSRRQVVMRHLVDALGAGEIGQAVLAEIDERDAGWQLVLGRVHRRLRADDLTRRRRWRADGRLRFRAGPNQLPARCSRCTGVHCHPDPEWVSGWSTSLEE